MTTPGTIYLVGTGPGDEDLITVKGLALLKEADAIVGDVLSYAKLMQLTRPTAQIHDVGCRAAHNKRPPAEINRLLVDLAQQGHTVVRLWAGDPFIFGRAAEEMAYILQAGLKVEFVPGISSAIAAPAYAGVPVTHWEYATSFGVVTGYASKNPAVKPNWQALAGMETVVILMPLDDLPAIVQRLITAGRSADTPALAVQEGTLPQQKQVLATLGSLVEAVKQHNIQYPTIVVVGQVAALHQQIAWFKPDDTLSLLGQRVLVTRPNHQATGFMTSLRALGATPIAFPTIQIKPIDDNQLLDKAIQHLLKIPQSPNPPISESPYDWLVLTSANGVSALWQRLIALGGDSRNLAGLKIVAIGPATADALQRRSIRPDLMPDVYTAEGVLAAFDQWGEVTGQRFLLTRADIARKTLAQGLFERGAIVDEIPAYRTVPVAHGPIPPPADIVTFTSSSTVQGYVNCLGGQSPADFLSTSQVVCIGPITAATAQELAVPVTAVAQDYTIDGVLEAVQSLTEKSRILS